MNSYQHLLKTSYTVNEDTVNWVLNLRNKSDRRSLPNIPDVPFSLYGKNIKCQEQKRTPDFSVTGSDNKQQTSHLFWHRGSVGSLGYGQLAFETGLRNYSKTNLELTSKELLFRATAYKNRSEFPFFIKHEVKIKKGKNETERAWEGRVPYPQYDSKHANTNFNLVKNLLQPGLEIGQINWELSLRNGANHRIGKLLKKGDFPFKKIGDFATKH